MSEDTTKTPVLWSQLLHDAVNVPGKVMSAYSAFWNYSSGNQLLAMWQLTERGLPVGPIATFRAWQDKGRYVKKGQKAIELCMPVTRKFERENAETGEKEVGQFRRFIFKRNWFALSQTDGDTYIPDPIPAWDRTQALSTLGVTEIPFQMTNGNVQGYAQEMSIAVNPLAAMPDKTTFHELGHVMLGHTMEGHSLDTEATPRNLKEVEAESVALICLESLGLTGAEFCRGYIQSWKAEIPERSAQKIFNAADKILKAGRMVEHDGTEDRQDYD